MSVLEKDQIVELARKSREIDERPSTPLEPFYLRTFEKHAASFPNDLNFIVELAKPGKPGTGGNGFGVATCLEDYCWVDVVLGPDPDIKDGGKKNGCGSLWEYQVHCDTPNHAKGRNERCSKGITYITAANANAAPAPAPAAPVPPPRAPAAGPSSSASRTPSAASQPRAPMTAPPPRAVPASSSTSALRQGSSSANVLQPSTRDNLPQSSPSVKTERKPFVGLGGSNSMRSSKSVLSMLDSFDDEVSVVQPEDVPMEFRKVTNKDAPYLLDDEDDEVPPPPAAGSSNAAPAPVGAPAQNVIVQREPRPYSMQPKLEPQQAPAPPALVVSPQNLPGLQAELARMKLDRDSYIRQAYTILLASVAANPGIRTEIHNYANKMATIIYGGEEVYPAIPATIAAHLPTFVPLDTTSKIKHDHYVRGAANLKAGVTYAQSMGWLAPIGSSAPAPVPAPAQAGPSSIVPPMAPFAQAPPALRVLPNPLGLEGQELEDYHAEVYGERNPPTNLQDFFQDALKDFAEDNDIDKALTTLGLDSMDQKFANMTVSLMPHQILGVAFMLSKEKDKRYRGGLLCDAMGLGKTVQTIATIAGNPSEDGRVKTTLIVAPLAVINQWKQEIESKTADGLLTVYVHHGPTRAKNTKDLKHADVVLTTYGTLVSDFAEPKQKKKKARRPEDGSDDEEDERAAPTRKKGPCFKMRWYRVVLDEAHFIRNKNTQASKAVWDLDSLYRWSLTGTLINNSLDDVFPHLRFLGISPQQEYAEFSKHITKIVKKAPRKAATKVQAILKTCMMRRHKESELNGVRLLNLPPKETTELELDFTEEERAIYMIVEKRMKMKFSKFLRAGTVLKNISCILTMLMRLRQLCCHPWLLRRNPGDPAHPDDFEVSDEDLNASMNVPLVNAGADFINAASLLGENWVVEITAKLKARHDLFVNAPPSDEEAEKDNECSVCLEAYDAETITECKHSFCRTCINEIFATPPGDGGDLTDEQSARGARKCPMCRAVIEKNKLFAAIAFFDPEAETGAAKPEDGASGSGSAPGSDRKGKRKSLGNGEDDDAFEESAVSAKKIDKGKYKAVVDEEEEEAPLDEIRSVLPSTKMKVLGQLVEKYLAEDGVKIIIFSEFVTYLKLVERFLDCNDIPNRMYHGGMRNKDREEVIKEFTGPIKTDRSPRVMLISRKAGGAGLNLTAASKVISLDLAWNAAAENQAVDRAHRIGQTRPVDVQRLIIKDTVEQRILELQERKSALADGAMGEGAGGRLGRLTVRDLMRLFDFNDSDD